MKIYTSLHNDLFNADVVWVFMGKYRYVASKTQVCVQEYVSLATPPLAIVKDKIKSLIAPKADVRVFLNPYVEAALNFRTADDKRFFRDMAVHDNLANASINRRADKEVQFDLIYVGAMDKSREIDKDLKKIIHFMPEIKIVLVGQPDPYIIKAMEKQSANLTFVGRVSPTEVIQYMEKSAAALNSIPCRKPYSAQTSTKLIEYLSAGLPIITSPSAWSVDHLKQNRVPYVTVSEYIAGKQPKSYTPVKSQSWEEYLQSTGIGEYLHDLVLERNA